MIDMNVRYQASLFANLLDMTATPDNTFKMMSVFKDYGLLPSTFQEITPFNPTPTIRTQFSSANGEWVVRIASRRIDVEKNPTDGVASNMGSIDDFQRTACNLISLFLEAFGKKGTRVSLCSNSLLREMESEMLADVYKRIMNPLEYYKVSTPNEWNIRSVGKESYMISETQERVNVITNISRSQGQMVQNNTPLEFDRIVLEFDINTVQENEDPRLESNALPLFFENAILTRNILISQIERAIYG